MKKERKMTPAKAVYVVTMSLWSLAKGDEKLNLKHLLQSHSKKKNGAGEA